MDRYSERKSAGLPLDPANDLSTIAVRSDGQV